MLSLSNGTRGRQGHAADHSALLNRQGGCAWQQPPLPAPLERVPWPPRQYWPGGPPGAQAIGGWQEVA